MLLIIPDHPRNRVAERRRTRLQTTRPPRRV